MSTAGPLKEAEMCLANGAWDEAIERFQNLSLELPTTPEVHIKLALALAVRGRFGAIVGTYLQWARAALECNNLEQAEVALGEALSLRPESLEARELRIDLANRRRNDDLILSWTREFARLALEQGEGERSVEKLRLACEERPDNLELSLELAETCLAQGLIKEGEARYRAVANAYLEHNRPQQALESFRRLKVICSEDPELLMQVGRLYLATQLLDEAEQEFRAVLRLNLEHEEALMALGQVCQLKGRFRSSLLAFRKVSNLNPNHAEAVKKSAELHLTMGNPEEALELLLQGGVHFLEEGARELAVEFYQLALGIDRDNLNAQQALTNLGAPREGKEFLLEAPEMAEPEPPRPEPVAAETEPVVVEPEPVVAEPRSALAEPEPVEEEAKETPRWPRSGLIKKSEFETAKQERKPVYGKPRVLRPGLKAKPGLTMAKSKPPLRRKPSLPEPATPVPSPEPVRPEFEPQDEATLVASLFAPEVSEPVVEAVVAPVIEPEPEVEPEPVESLPALEWSEPEAAVEPAFKVPEEEITPFENWREEESIFQGFEGIGQEAPEEAEALFPDFQVETEEETEELTFDLEPQTETEEPEELIFGLSPETEEEAEELTFDLEPQTENEESEELIFGLSPETEEEAEELTFDLEPQTEPQIEEAEELIFGLSPETAEEAEELTFDLEPEPETEPETEESEELIFDLSPETEEEAEELNFDLEPQTEPQTEESEELIFGLSPETEEEAEELTFDFEPETEPQTEESEELIFGLSPETEEEPEELTFDLEPEAEEPEKPVGLTIPMPPVEPAQPDEAAMEQQWQEEVERLEDLLKSTLPESARELGSEPTPEVVEPEEAVAEPTLMEALEAHQEKESAAATMARLREVLRLNPVNQQARLELGDLLLRFGMVGEAVEHYRRALQQEPNSLGVHRRMIEAELWNDNPQGAAETLISSARIHLERGDFQESLDRVTTLLALDPTHPEARTFLIAVFEALQEQALAAYHLTQMAEESLSRGDTEQALSAFERLLAIKPTAALRERVAEQYQALGDAEKAQQNYQALVDLFSQQQNWTEAVRIAERVARLYPGQLDQAEQLQTLYEQLGDRGKVVEHRFRLAQAFLERGQLARAIEECEALLDSQPEHLEAHHLLLQVYLDTLNQEAALSQFERLAQLFLETEQHSALRELSIEVLRHHPRMGPTLLERLLDRNQTELVGEVLAQVEQPDELRDGLLESLRQQVESDQDLEVRSRFASLCFHLGDFDSAIEQYQLLRRHPDHEVSSYRMLGLCFARRHGATMLELAIRQFRKGLSVASPQEQDALRYDLARVLSENGRKAEALTELGLCQTDFRDVSEWMERLKTEV